MAGHQLGCASAAQLAFRYFASLGFGLVWYTALVLFANSHLAFGANHLLSAHVKTSTCSRAKLSHPATEDTTGSHLATHTPALGPILRGRPAPQILGHPSPAAPVGVGFETHRASTSERFSPPLYANCEPYQLGSDTSALGAYAAVKTSTGPLASKQKLR
jgi:hypothetical protein